MEKVHTGISLFLCCIKALEIKWDASAPHSKVNTDQDNAKIM